MHTVSYKNGYTSPISLTLPLISALVATELIASTLDINLGVKRICASFVQGAGCSADANDFSFIWQGSCYYHPETSRAFGYTEGAERCAWQQQLSCQVQRMLQFPQKLTMSIVLEFLMEEAGIKHMHILLLLIDETKKRFSKRRGKGSVNHCRQSSKQKEIVSVA